MDIQEAIAFCKSQGYSVTKPREKKLKTVGPTFVAHWIDGTITRMSIHTLDEKPDFKRAVRVSHAAYESRWRKNYKHGDYTGGFARALYGHFERNGKPLSPPDYIDADQYL